MSDLAWVGKCSACGQRLVVSEVVDRPDGALLLGYPYRVMRSTLDSHACAAQPYRLERPYDPEIDMAHPIHDARFVPDADGPLYRAGIR